MKSENEINEKLDTLENKLDQMNGENNLQQYLEIFNQVLLLKWVLEVTEE